MTITTSGPLWRIDGPLPQPPVYSLLKSARVVDDTDGGGVERWGNGIQVYPYPPDPAHVIDACGAGSEVAKGDGGTFPLPEFGAMTVYLAETCSSFGIWGQNLSNDQAQARFVARASAALAAVESAAIEMEFVGGFSLGNNPHLADGNGTFPNGNTVTSVVNAFALLENEIAKSGKQGMIHCTPSIATFAKSQHMLGDYDWRDGNLHTALGTIVVPGYGYAQAGSSPPAHTVQSGTKEWLYATGMVEIRRSEMIILPEEVWMALDRKTNSLTYRVERYYAVDWDTTVQSAVLCDRCQTTC